MAVRKIDEKEEEKTTILRVTIPKNLLEDIRKTKKLCKEKGLYFDIKPDVKYAIEKAIEEAKKAIEETTHKP
ncbi:MAG: hypothetical protein HQK79_15040 [Desulfobacterales bacterium]|nr:hypothetical protein [Desulfobacterales bacterium]MBF0395724.1 hypothetical protein [Desulfobacterales bacterium]